jgi:hypothetical protein
MTPEERLKRLNEPRDHEDSWIEWYRIDVSEAQKPSRIYGGPGNDILIGSSVNDVIIGGPGADIILGGAGADVLYGGNGQRYQWHELTIINSSGNGTFKLAVDDAATAEIGLGATERQIKEAIEDIVFENNSKKFKNGVEVKKLGEGRWGIWFNTTASGVDMPGLAVDSAGLSSGVTVAQVGSMAMR